MINEFDLEDMRPDSPSASPPSEDKRDANRYRWLRDSERFPDEMDGTIIVGEACGESILTGEQLDRAIDAAITKGA
jgi:hypothetical protein